jgi:hypothetical protein
MGLLYGRAGRLTTENGGLRPGQNNKSHDADKDRFPDANAGPRLWTGVEC